jgi:Zn-dependent M28 family amino/carboxypeptidase
MLPTLYQSLASHPRSHTFLFIGFSGEEQGLVGSDFYAKHLTPEERKQIAAMVNLECLGISKTEVWTSHSEPILIRMLVAMAQSMNLPLGGINVEQVGTTDSESFAHYSIPRITITAITQDTLALLHSKKDNIKAITPELYYDSYRLITPYLVLLDQQIPTDGSSIEKKAK